MKKRWFDSIRAALLAAILILLWKNVEWFPWWTFIVPLIALGLYARIRKWRIGSFVVGFVTGFLIWSLGNLYFSMNGDGLVLRRLALSLSVHPSLVFVAAGLIGGLLSGVALYIGNQLFIPAKSNQYV